MALRKGFEELLQATKKGATSDIQAALPLLKASLASQGILTSPVSSHATSDLFKSMTSSLTGLRGKLGAQEETWSEQERREKEGRIYQSAETEKNRQFQKSERLERQSFMQGLERLRDRYSRRNQRSQLLSSLLGSGVSMLGGGIAGSLMPDLFGGDKGFLKGALAGLPGVASKITEPESMSIEDLLRLISED